MMMRSFFKATVLICSCTAAAYALPQGERLEQWMFFKGNASPTDSTEGWESVTVPHSWNIHDGQDGGSYYRGPGWYQHALDIQNYDPESRYFLRFHAVGTAADVFLNGQAVTNHLGGYTAFAMEITKRIHGNGTYDLRVRADNTHRDDTAPLSGDFTIAGGIHRPVDLLIEHPICFSVTNDASPGVRLFQEQVCETNADLRIEALIDNRSDLSRPVRILASLENHLGETVATEDMQCMAQAGKEKTAESTLTLENPHLWHGTEDPYLYTLTVQLYDGTEIVDTYVKKVGFRFMHIDPESGFYLNGKPYPLRGVNLHHDHQVLGAALTAEQIRKDYALVDELGANTVRLAHYPHSALSHELCDKLGFLVWAEIPVVNEMRDTPEFVENAKQQLMEMIRQLGNHCSIYCWGLTNEMFQRKTDEPFRFLKELHELCIETDPGRYTILATNRNRSDLNTIPDLFGINSYPGWYGSNPHEMSGAMPGYNTRGGSKGLSVSEYGAGGSILHHDQSLTRVQPKGKWHPEQWQAYLHECQYQSILDYPPCWGSYIWLMFDFASDGRNEGDRAGVNDKGLITHDHLTRKDAFYFYKANWSDSLVLHLTSQRHRIRTEEDTPVKVYSNCESVELTVNGTVIGVQHPNELKVALWDSITLNKGENRITVKAPKENLMDETVWVLDPDADVLTAENSRSSVIAEGKTRASDAQAGNGPGQAFDGNPDTRWGSEAKEPWIAKELDQAAVLRGISILWFKGHERSYRFELETSMDGNTWRPVYQGSSQKTGEMETYLFEVPENASHIRVICSGSDLNQWSCINEISTVE